MKDGTKIYARLGMTKFRDKLKALLVLIQQEIPQSIFTGDLFMFCGCDRRMIKILYWDRNGFCLWQKKVERGKFPWPRKGCEFKEITRDQFDLIFRGIDFWDEHREIEYKKIF